MTANKLYTVGILGYFVTLIGLMSMVVSWLNVHLPTKMSCNTNHNHMLVNINCLVKHVN